VIAKRQQHFEAPTTFASRIADENTRVRSGAYRLTIMDNVIANGELAFVSRRQFGALGALIAGCRSAGRTYRSASDIVSNVEHRKLLLALSRRRSSFVDDLSKFGGARAHLPSTGSILGLMRWALQSLGAIQGPHDGEIFRECAKAEARVLHLYARALSRVWPLEMRNILSNQSREIETSYDRMRTLRGLH